MQDKSINDALVALRKQIMRGDGKGLDHVEALLIMRGVHMPRVLPTKRADVCRRGGMTRLVLQALQDGPKRLPEVAAYVDVAKPEIGYDLAYSRTGQALTKIKERGLIQRDGRLWRLA